MLLRLSPMKALNECHFIGRLPPGPRELSTVNMNTYLSENIQQSFSVTFRLLEACRYVRLSDVKAIFELEKSQINILGKWIVDNIGQTPLHNVCDGPANTPDRNQLVELLLTELAVDGVSVDATDNSGNTPLNYAAHHGNAVALELLLNKGAKVEGGNNAEKNSPLMEAAASGVSVNEQ